MSTPTRIGVEAMDYSRNGESQWIQLRQHPSTANLASIRATISQQRNYSGSHRNNCNGTNPTGTDETTIQASPGCRKVVPEVFVIVAEHALDREQDKCG